MWVGKSELLLLYRDSGCIQFPRQWFLLGRVFLVANCDFILSERQHCESISVERQDSAASRWVHADLCWVRVVQKLLLHYVKQ